MSRSTSQGGSIKNEFSKQLFQFPSPRIDHPNEAAASEETATTEVEQEIPVTPTAATIVAEPSHAELDDISTDSSARPTYARAFSVQSLDDTPRPSVDLYAHKNDSNETLMSDYPFQATKRLLQRPLLGSIVPQKQPHVPHIPTSETLMMGYVQIFGSFVLDESLVNSSPFEEVKRRTVVGGQGGGSVVGLGSMNGDESFMSAFKWTSITDSIGGILGGAEQSSIRQMKDIAESKNVPLLSTPKSILFVNMKLEPGESQSFKYTFPLPRGLPPTHKGRAMKMTYNLAVAAQRPSNRRGPQDISQVDVPFRVFSGVNDRGESLGHDLMAPYIITNDQAKIEAVEEHANSATFEVLNGHAVMASSAADFDSYVRDLLSTDRSDTTTTLLSPTSDLQVPEAGTVPYTPALTNPTARNLIDQAVRQTTVASGSAQAPSVFTIARASVPIATLSLSRSVVKLGDLLFVAIDFSKSSLPCYAIEATLESSEAVDPTLAIRSRQSVERATRRIWARGIENAVCARRCVFKAQIPVLATPGFSTSGVSLDWCVRVELVVGHVASEQDAARKDSAEGEGPEEAREPATTVDQSMLHKAERLLEVVHSDERGTVLSAAQRLYCDSFEVTIPLRVFGAARAGGDNGTGAEGLAI